MCQKVAIAQALLARPGLLVLDEAWTGLDQAARGALDTAVTERLAAGACVLFVDHDPARLARRVDERWRLAGGTVTVTSETPRQPGDRGAVDRERASSPSRYRPRGGVAGRLGRLPREPLDQRQGPYV